MTLLASQIARRFPFLGLCAFFCGVLPAQNLVKNGSFNAGNTLGWTISGYAVRPGLRAFATSGAAASQAYSCRPGSKKGTLPPGGSHQIEQKILLVKGVPHLCRLDVAVENTLPLTNVDAGTIEVWAAGVRLARARFGAIRPRQVFRRQVCIRFTPAAGGLQSFKVVMSRAWGAKLGTPRHHVDDISVLRGPRAPILCPRLERKIGGTLTLDAYGTPKAPFVVLVAASRTKPLTIPGIGGALVLPLPPLSVPLLTGSFDTAGARRFALPLPAAIVGFLAGLALHWQGLEVTPRAASLGDAATFGVYR